MFLGPSYKVGYDGHWHFRSSTSRWSNLSQCWRLMSSSGFLHMESKPQVLQEGVAHRRNKIPCFLANFTSVKHISCTNDWYLIGLRSIIPLQREHRQKSWLCMGLLLLWIQFSPFKGIYSPGHYWVDQTTLPCHVFGTGQEKLKPEAIDLA